MNLNKVLLIGRLGKDPQTNYYKPDTPVCRFTLATSDYYIGKNGEKIETTEWHNIVAWNNNAKFAEKYLKKGMLVYIEGRLNTRKWDAQDGTTKYQTEIVVDDIKILEKKQDSNDYGNQTTNSQPDNHTTNMSNSAKNKNSSEISVIDSIIEKDLSENSMKFHDDEINDDLPF